MRDYAELVKEMREGAEWAEKLCAYDTAKRQSDAADAIEELVAVCKQQEIDLVNLTGQLAEVAAKVPKWISVEERLPKIDDYGYSKDVYVTDGEYVEHAFLYKAGDELFWSCAAGIDIFFWCDGLYMPEPPKGVE